MNDKKIPFPIEDISDESILFCRVHKHNIDIEKGTIKPIAFDPTPYSSPDGLSVNWNKYATAEETKAMVIDTGKKPENYDVISFEVKKVRNIPLKVIHKPTKNQAHSLILDIPAREANDARVTSILSDNDFFKWEIRF
jgi:hypothetical protein